MADLEEDVTSFEKSDVNGSEDKYFFPVAPTTHKSINHYLPF